MAANIHNLPEKYLNIIRYALSVLQLEKEE